jgi:hypothetical protein
MKRSILAIAFTALLLLPMQTMSAEVPARTGEEEALLARLESQIPSGPTIPSPEIVNLIHEVGATKRLDAAWLLVRALVFGFSPIGQSEARSPFGLLPAAQSLKSNFGSKALPLLMFSGVSTKEAWLQIRIALVIRETATAAEIKLARDAFSVEESKNPTARQFAARLAEPELNLSEDPVLSQVYELRKMLEEFKKKNPSSKDKTKEPPKPPGADAI